jgi:hypothetical protein
MKRAERELALKAHRMRLRKHDSATIARKLGIRELRPVISNRVVIGSKISDNLGLIDPDRAHSLAENGRLIFTAESHCLTDNERLVMTALARVEARRVHLAQPGSCELKAVDFAAGKRSGWARSIAKKRLAHAVAADGFYEFQPDRFGFLVMNDRGAIWLTASGWAFVWATGLVLKNWKVPT